MNNDFFDFTNTENKHTVDYLSMIENKHAKKLVSNFFEPSVLACITPKMATLLAEAINKDLQNKVFFVTTEYKISAFNRMNENQLNSESHKLFLKIIASSFGKSAAKTLKQRKNLNIFNLTEVHVLHQEIFDNFGEGFVNRILNNDLTPQSLIIIKNVLSDKKEMNTFKYYYDFYTKNVGNKQTDFDRMIRGYEQYKVLINDIIENKHTLTSKQKETLSDILRDTDNSYSINKISEIDNFYEIKDQKYFLNKEKQKTNFQYGVKSKAVASLAKAIFKNYYGVKATEYNPEYEILDISPFSICKYYDIDDIIENDTGKSFTKDEIELMKDMRNIVDISNSVDTEKAFNQLLEICDKFEKRGNKTSLIATKMFDKIPSTFEKEVLDSLTTISSIKEKAESSEKGIHIAKDPQTIDGETVDFPVYVFDGADFSFLSTTNFLNGGLGRNNARGDLATTWFEYENGSTHICCSYANQDKLSNLEFNKIFPGKRVTYFFDDAEIFTMGDRDIYSNETTRTSNVSSSHETMFVKPSKLIEGSSEETYNEIDINRFNYNNENIEYGGKIIPSGILCCDCIDKHQLDAAQSFTNYCIEHGLKPKGWKMPIVVVNKEKYLKLQKKKRKEFALKNSEYFVREDNEEKQLENGYKQIQQNTIKKESIVR